MISKSSCIGEESFYTWHCVYTNDESSLCMQGFPYTHHCEYVLNFLQLQPRVDLEYLDHKSSAAKNQRKPNRCFHTLCKTSYILLVQVVLSVKNEMKDRNERHYFHDKGAFMDAITLEIPQKHNLTTTKKRRGAERRENLF